MMLIVLVLVAAACSTTAEDTNGFAQYNPPPADPPPPDWSVPGELQGLQGLNRCESTDQGFADLGECEQTADEISAKTTAGLDLITQQTEQQTEETAFEESIGTRTLVKRDGQHVCFIDADEFVTPAPPDVVVDVLLEAGIIGAADEVRPIDDSDGPLPAQLAAFALVTPSPNPIDASRALLDNGIPASPRHTMVLSPRWLFGPGSAPLPADPNVVAEQGTLSEAVAQPITVIDTGVPATNPLGAPWTQVLGLAASEPEPDGIEADIKGHGVFIAGIIRRLLPRAQISVRSPIPPKAEGALFDEHAVIAAITRALAAELENGGVVNLSLGTYACEPDMIPLELAAFLGETPGITFVAAAGNDAHRPQDDPFWPAGFADQTLLGSLLANWPVGFSGDLEAALTALLDSPNVVGVGALVDTGGNWQPVWFSNQVGATAWAPGTNIVSNYPGWEGFAQWDGTSFAAPHMTALVASNAGP